MFRPPIVAIFRQVRGYAVYNTINLHICYALVGFFNNESSVPSQETFKFQLQNFEIPFFSYHFNRRPFVLIVVICYNKKGVLKIAKLIFFS